MKARTIEEIQQSQQAVAYDNFEIGDYVFATKFVDAAPTDRWIVDYVSRKDDNALYFANTGVIPFNFAQKISDEEGRAILKAWKGVYP